LDGIEARAPLPKPINNSGGGSLAKHKCALPRARPSQTLWRSTTPSNATKPVRNIKHAHPHVQIERSFGGIAVCLLAAAIENSKSNFLA